MQHNAYVYTISVNGIVRYIGKGTGKRMFVHVREARGNRPVGYFQRQLRVAIKDGADVQAVALVSGLSEEDAFIREEAEISAAPAGQLWNAFGGYRRGSRKISSSNRRARVKLSQAQKTRFADKSELAKHKARMNEPEYRAKQSAAAKKRYSDPDERSRMAAIAKRVASDPHVKEKLRAKAKARWSDPAYRAKSRATMKVVHNTLEARALQSAISEKMWSDRERRERFAEWSRGSWAQSKKSRKAALKNAWGSPETKAKHRAYLDSPEGRAKLSAASKARWDKHRATA